MDHAGDTHVVDVGEFAGSFCDKVDTRSRFAHDLVRLKGFHRDVVGKYIRTN